MPRRPSAILALVLLLVAGTVHAAPSIWPAGPGYLPISNNIGSSYFRQDAVIPDGAGGGFLAWNDASSIRVQHKLVSGLIATGWVSVGSIACPSSFGGQRDEVSLAPDAGQGVYVAWVDFRPGDIADIYLQHLNPDGTLAAGWPAGGVRVTTAASSYDYYDAILADGAGGVYVSWIANNTISGAYIARVTRLTSSGAFAPGWSSAGVALHTTGAVSWPAGVVTDGANGVIASFGVGNQLRVQHVLANGTQDVANWPADGTVVTNNAVFGTSNQPALVSRGFGEIFLAWSDTRFGQSDEYVLRLTANGAAPGWAANGVAVANSGFEETEIAATPDGKGGVLLAWVDNGASTFVARRMLANGTYDPAWPAGGRVLGSFNTAGTGHVSVAPALSNGMVVLTTGFNTGTFMFEVKASRVREGGTIPAEWAAGPTLMCLSSSYLPTIRAVPDASDGAIGFFLLSPAGQYIEAGQRVRWDGTLGMVPRPRITSVRDTGPDQGGQVRVFCNATDGDSLPNNAVASYALWRQVTATTAQAMIARGANVARPDAAGGAPLVGLREARTASGVQLYWEYVGSWPSRAVSAYSQLVTTASDSLPGSIPWERFVVDAVGANNAVIATSPADSGYSVDNLSPAPPIPFLAAYVAGGTHLHWVASPEADFHQFVLHRGTSAGFVPDVTTLVASLGDTGYVDPGAAGSFYKLAAVDVHGNVGAYALVTPAMTTDVEAAPIALEFARPTPNPARGQALLRYVLPHAGEMELALFDVSGRRVRVLARGTHPAGSFTERWDGTDSNGRVLPDGVYLARLTFANNRLVQRLSLIR